MIIKVFLFLLLVASVRVYSQPETEELDDLDTKKKSEWVLLPIVFYTPETRAGAGLGFIHYFDYNEKEKDKKLSNISTSAVYTYNKQTQLVLIPTFYMNRGKIISSSKLSYIDYPKQFFGIGNHTDPKGEKFTQHGHQFNTSLRFECLESLFTGIIFESRYDEIRNKTADGMLSKGGYFGSDKAKMLASGWVISHDTRDNCLYTKNGHFFEFYTLVYLKEIGSDYHYYNLSLDLRQFFQITEKQVVGFQGFSVVTKGEVPFYSLPTLGGANMMRGIIQGRYREQSMTMIQTEYRFMLFEKFYISGFAGAGEVYRDFKDFSVRELQYAFGGGVRFKLTGNGATLRFDCGYGNKNTQFYLTVLEAF